MPNEIIESLCHPDWHRLYQYIVCDALQHISAFEENKETIFSDLKYLCQQHFDAECVY